MKLRWIALRRENIFRISMLEENKGDRGAKIGMARERDRRE